MCITIGISENGREKLGLTTCILDSVLALFGLILISLAIYMNVQLESKMNIMEGYDTGTVPYYLLVVGILMVLMNGLCAKVAFDCAYPESRARFQNLLVFLLGLKFVLVWLVFAGSIVCFTHREVIHESLRNGFTSVMKSYKKNLPHKVTIDQMQLQYKCCGSNGYTDWFTINWVNEDYINVKHPDVLPKLRVGKYYNDDVPFSCCNIASLRPCVHHDVRNKSMHRNYGDVTLYKTGCAHILMSFFDDFILTPTGWSILASFFFQFVAVILLRFLQTSIHDACDMESPLGLGAGYIIPNCPCDCCRTGDPMKYVNRGRIHDDDEGGFYDGIGDDYPINKQSKGVDEGGDNRGQNKEKENKSKKEKKNEKGKNEKKNEKGKNEKKNEKGKNEKKNEKGKKGEKQKSKSEKAKTKSPKEKNKSIKSKKNTPKSTKKTPSPKSKKKTPSPKSKKAPKSPKMGRKFKRR